MKKCLLNLFSYLAIFIFTGSLAHGETVLKAVTGSDPATFDPQLTNGTWEARINDNTFENLITLNAKGESIPGLAKSWTSNEDATVWTFKLRDAKWSDGAPIDADDVIFSFRRVLSQEFGSKYASMMFPIKNAYNFNRGEVSAKELGVKKLNDHTVQFTMEAPTPYFIGLLNHSTGAIVPKHTVEKFGSKWSRIQNIVVSGAYIPTLWEKNSKIVLEKNPKYYDADSVKIDKVILYPIEDSGSAVKKFLAGEADIFYESPEEKYNFIKSKAPESLRIAPFMGVYYYTINIQKEKFAKKEIRQALSMAIDRKYIADKILLGLAQPAYSWVPPGIQNMPKSAVPYWKEWTLEKRLQTAKEILTKNGYTSKKPMQVTISYNTLDKHKMIAIAVAAFWKKIGVAVKLSNSDVNTHYDNIEHRKFDIARAGWIADYNDPFDFLMLADIVYGGMNNYARYDSKEYHKYMLEAGSTADQKKRGEAFYQAEKILIDDMPNIPLTFYTSNNLVRPYIKGFVNNAIDRHPIKYMTIEK